MPANVALVISVCRHAGAVMPASCLTRHSRVFCATREKQLPCQADYPAPIEIGFAGRSAPLKHSHCDSRASVAIGIHLFLGRRGSLAAGVITAVSSATTRPLTAALTMRFRTCLCRSRVHDAVKRQTRRRSEGVDLSPDQTDGPTIRRDPLDQREKMSPEDGHLRRQSGAVQLGLARECNSGGSVAVHSRQVP